MGVDSGERRQGGGDFGWNGVRNSAARGPAVVSGVEGRPLVAAQPVVPVQVSAEEITPATFTVEIPVFLLADETVPVVVRPAERVVPGKSPVFPERSGLRCEAQK